MTAIDIACRVCAQQPGEPCIWTLAHQEPAPQPYFHAERILDADGFGAGAVSHQQVHAAVEAVLEKEGLI